LKINLYPLNKKLLSFSKYYISSVVFYYLRKMDSSKSFDETINIDDNLSNRYIDLDPKGYFIIKVDLVENKIIICTENAKRKTNYRSKKQSPKKDNYKTELAIRKALRHEATHAIQKCNNNKTVGDIKNLEGKLHESKRRSLEFSTSNFSGTYAKEVEAYILEDKPKKVKKLITKYCL